MKQISKKNILNVALGGAFEFYDYGVYAALSVYLAQLFFPQDSHAVAIMMTLAVFAMSLVIRPLGGFILGKIGDRHGRKKMLYLSSIIIGCTSVLITFLPTYSTIGIFAPALLLLLRMAQGFGLGGETSGMFTYMIESAPEGKKALYSGLISVVTISGVILGMLVVYLLHVLFTEQQVLTWAWRIPFGISVITLLFSLYYRLRLPEPPARKQSLQEKISRLDYPLTILTIVLTVSATAVFYYTYNFFGNVFVSQIDGQLSSNTRLLLPIFASLLLLILQVFLGKAADKYGWRKLTLYAMALLAVSGYPIFKGLTDQNIAIVITALICLAVIGGMVLCTMPLMIVTMSSRENRTSILGLGYNISLVIFGGFTPAINQFLIHSTNNSAMPGLYLSAVCAVAFLALLAHSLSTSKKKTAQISSATELFI